MLTIVLTSGRVAPGLLGWEAWDVLRSASRVLVGPAEHPQRPALAEAGITVEVAAGQGGPDGLARLLAEAAAGGPAAWLPPPGEEPPPAVLAALSAAGVAARVLPGPGDLPGAHLIDVVATMDTLRASCPWDRKQTHESLAPHLLEEPYEALEALETGDQQAFREELGDVLLQVAFHARIAAERPPAAGGYSIDDIADTLVAKLVRRHPHVFADVTARSADDVTRNWDEIKKTERAAKQGAGQAPPSVLDGVTFGQPALSLAAQVLRRAARAGFPADAVAQGPQLPPPEVAPGAEPQARAEGGEDIGDALLRLAALAMRHGTDPEAQLRAAVRKLMASVRGWELQQP
ncbi:MAG TPA: MazG family protein [Trebonia sp.]|jgi:XTP/dITP diphosphohydrolase|nr:MazG family protein [Trebonia sp.]